MNTTDKKAPMLPAPQPIIPDAMKKFPAMRTPPIGLEAYQLFRDKGAWSVWCFRVLPTGDIETERIVDRELFEVCRIRVAELTVDAQQRQLK